MNTTDFRNQGYAMIDRIAEYYEQIEKYPVLSQLHPGDVKNKLPENMPYEGEDFNSITNDIDNIIMPGITHWQHPGFMAMFPSNTSFPSILAELFSAGLGINAMFWNTSPAAAELEEQVLNWLRNAMGLPKFFEGVIHDTASTSTLTAIICAREKYAQFSVNENGFDGYTNCTMYCSEQAHYSVEKGARAAGIGKAHVRKIATDENFAMRIEVLEKTILVDIASDKKPFMVVATLGTTNTLAFDPLYAIGLLCKKYDLWLHVDAAYAGSAFILPEYQYLHKGIENADSFVVNAHKWLMTNFDCSCFFIKDTRLLINTFTHNPDYINAASDTEVRNYKDWGLPLGRKFRALKLWFVMRHYGLNGLQKILRNHIQIATTLHKQFLENTKWEILASFAMNVLCVRYNPDSNFSTKELNMLNEKILTAINSDGKYYLTGTKLHGNFVIRIAPGQEYVTQQHTDALFTLLTAKAKALSGN